MNCLHLEFQMASCSVSLFINIKPKDKYSTVPFVQHLISEKLLLCGTWELSQDQRFCFVPEKSFIIETDISGSYSKRPLSMYVCMYVNHCDISWPLFSRSINFYSYEYYRKHRIGWSWLWTSRWRRHPKGIVLWLVVQSNYRSSKKLLPVRTSFSISYLLLTPWLYGPLGALASLILRAYFSLCATFSCHLIIFISYRSFST